MQNQMQFNVLEQFTALDSFDKQFLAVRYLLLGLMHDNPLYKPALLALEDNAKLTQAYVIGGINPKYQRVLVEVIKRYAVLEHLDQSDELFTHLLTATSEDKAELAAFQAQQLDEEDIDSTGSPEVPGTKVFSPYDKLFLSMQYFLLGAGVNDRSFLVAHDALIFGAETHKGLRKDGKTPEYQHQLEIAHWLRTHLKNMLYPAETLMAAFLHDAPEDYGVKKAVIAQRFGHRVAHSTQLLNKYDENGELKETAAYYAAQGLDAIASLVKPADNGQNQSTMSGVFVFKKIAGYIHKIKTYSWSMIKVARRTFPEQEAVYESLKFLLRIQYNAAQALLAAVEYDPETGEAHPALKK